VKPRIILNAFKKAVLLVDSKSAIQTTASNKQATTQMVQEIRRTLNLNKQGKTIAFQWIPSHVGIHGNETTDLLAKKGTTLLSKHKAIPLQALTSPEGSSRLRLPDFMTIGT
jgi:ribonuclease HI